MLLIDEKVQTIIGNIWFKKNILSFKDRIGLTARSVLDVNQRGCTCMSTFASVTINAEVNVGTMRELKNTWCMDILVIDFRSHSPFFR